MPRLILIDWSENSIDYDAIRFFSIAAADKTT
jgi:hypothetical protein